MKKLLSLFLFFFIFSNNLFAQEFWSNERDGPTSIESAKKIFAGKKLDHIEGIWFADGLGTVAIFKENNIFKMYIVEGDTDFNGTWEATINKEENLKYNYIGRIWYTRTDGYDFGTQNANIEVDGSGNSFSIHYERLSNEGVNMDGKFTRVWPDNIFAYNNNLDRTVDSSNSGTSSINTVDEKKIEDREKRLELYKTLNWKNFDNAESHKLKISKSNVSIEILESEYYLDNWKDINQFTWWAFGLPAEKDQIVLIMGNDYTIYTNWIDDGYVKLDEWKNVNSKKLMEGLREIQKNNIEYLKEKNLSYSTNISWIYEPNLNEEKKVVSYSYKVKWSDNTVTMESKSLKLGKKGYVESAYVSSVDKNTDFTEVAKNSREFAEYMSFDENFRHSDYKSGDKVAALGIGGLVAGTLGVKALAKAGILAKFLPLLAKFWWIIVAPLVAIFGFLGKNDTSKDSRRRKK